MVLIERPRDGALLVSEHLSPSGAAFQRPLGGHIEFGERAVDTAKRELAEEIGQNLREVTLVGVLENIFLWDDEPQHEVVFLLRAKFEDKAAYETKEQTIRDATKPTRVLWRAADAEAPPLYPSGVSSFLRGPRDGALQPPQEPQ